MISSLNSSLSPPSFFPWFQIFINFLCFSHLYLIPHLHLNATGAIRCLYDLISAAPTRKVFDMIHPAPSISTLSTGEELRRQAINKKHTQLFRMIIHRSSLPPSFPPTLILSFPPSLPSFPPSLFPSFHLFLLYRWCACLLPHLESWLPLRMTMYSQKCSLLG